MFEVALLPSINNQKEKKRNCTFTEFNDSNIYQKYYRILALNYEEMSNWF